MNQHTIRVEGERAFVVCATWPEAERVVERLVDRGIYTQRPDCECGVYVWLRGDVTVERIREALR